jgi:precorrin-6B methylase 2
MTEQIIIFAAILIVLVTLRLLRYRIRYWGHLLMERGWKSSVHYDRCLKILTKLYENVSPFSISLEERKLKNIQADKSFTYGEVVFYSFAQILELAQPKPGEIFYDLGCGAGKPVFIAALVFDFAKACGVEKLENLYKLCVTLNEKLPTLPEVKELPADKKINIQFINDDFLKVDISEADIVFINATCFHGDLWDAILARLLKLKVGARVILTTRIINIGGFKLKHQSLFLMSWGLSQVSIYERIP